MSETPKGRPPGIKGGKKLQPLCPATVEALLKVVPTRVMKPSDKEPLCSKAMFRTESMDHNLGILLSSLHAYPQAVQKLGLSITALGDCEESRSLSKVIAMLGVGADAMKEIFCSIAHSALEQSDEGFFEQVAYGVSVLKSMDHTRLVIAEAWLLAGATEDPPSAALVTELANKNIGSTRILKTSRVTKDLIALGLPYSRSGPN